MVESRKAVEGLIFRPLTLRERTLIATVRAKNLSPLPTLKGNISDLINVTGWIYLGVDRNGGRRTLSTRR